jgi:ribosomal protein L11
MAKRYGLNSIIGKKSTLRFPRSVSHTKTDTICTIVAANKTLSEPPFSTAITMKKGDSLDICDQLNEISYEYEDNFPIKADIYLSNGNAKIDIKTPTTFSLINIIYELDDFLVENLRASLPNISIIMANIALTKIDTQDAIFVEELIKTTKTIYGNLTSYNCRRRKDKRINALKKNRKIQLYKKLTNIVSKMDSHRRDLHYFLKTKKVLKREKLPLLFDKIDEFYDLYEDWDDFHDEYFQDNYLNNYEYISLYLYISEIYFLKSISFKDNNKIPNILWYQNLISKFLDESNFEASLLLSYKLIQNQE